MTYPSPPSPQPPSGPADPIWSSGQPGGQPDPALPMSGAPISGDQYPSYSADGYSAQPVGYPPSGYPGYGYPTVVAAPPTNGMAIAAMVVSLVGILGLCGYGLGGYIGVVGAVLGHIAKRQIRERGESGDGMALAGIILGWIATAIAVIATIIIVALVIWAANADPSTFDTN